MGEARRRHGEETRWISVVTPPDVQEFRRDCILIGLRWRRSTTKRAPESRCLTTQFAQVSCGR
jgi:hypothetical protein